MSENTPTEWYFGTIGMLGTIAVTAWTVLQGQSTYSMFLLGWFGATMLTAYAIDNND